MTGVTGFTGLAKVMQVKRANNMSEVPERLEALKAGLMEQTKRRGAALPDDILQALVMDTFPTSIQQGPRRAG